jgi:hypothetical protein
MEVMVAVQSGTLLHALRVPLKRRVSARRRGGYNEVPQAIQKKSIFERIDTSLEGQKFEG